LIYGDGDERRSVFMRQQSISVYPVRSAKLDGFACVPSNLHKLARLVVHINEVIDWAQPKQEETLVLQLVRFRKLDDQRLDALAELYRAAGWRTCTFPRMGRLELSRSKRGPQWRGGDEGTEHHCISAR
jgi:hypothetical protein